MSGPNSNPTPEQLEAFRQLVARLPSSSTAASGGGGGGGLPDLALHDILSPSSLAPLFSTTASPSTSKLSSIFPTLPSDLPTAPSPEVLRRVVESPQFQAQVRALDRALSTGLVGGLMTGLGLPAEAGLGIRPFLDAIKNQARERKEEGQEEMETD